MKKITSRCSGQGQQSRKLPQPAVTPRIQVSLRHDSQRQRNRSSQTSRTISGRQRSTDRGRNELSATNGYLVSGCGGTVHQQRHNINLGAWGCCTEVSKGASASKDSRMACYDHFQTQSTSSIHLFKTITVDPYLERATRYASSKGGFLLGPGGSSEMLTSVANTTIVRDVIPPPPLSGAGRRPITGTSRSHGSPDEAASNASRSGARQYGHKGGAGRNWSLCYVADRQIPEHVECHNLFATKPKWDVALHLVIQCHDINIVRACTQQFGTCKRTSPPPPRRRFGVAWAPAL